MIKWVSTEIDGLTLRGTAYIPENGQQPLPTVLMFHGFSSNRDEAFGSFVQMSRKLNHHGIAAVAFDYGCHGESDGEFIDFTFTQELRESMKLVSFVESLDFVDENRLALLGMSLGGVAASMTAGKLPQDIRALCMWSPAAVFVDEIVKQHVLQGRSTERVARSGYFDFNSLKLGPTFFDDLKNIHIYQTAAQYSGPVAIIHGDADSIAPIAYSEKYQRIYRQGANLVEVPGATHAWNSVPVKTMLLEETLRFFSKTLLADDRID